MNESDVSRKLRVELQEQGAWAYKASDRFHASIPDILGCYQGFFLAIEVKIWPNTLTDLQDFTLNDLGFHNAAIFVITYHKIRKTYEIRHTRHLAIGTTTFCNHKDAVTWLLKQTCSGINTKP